MTRLVIGLLLTCSAFPQTPAEDALALNRRGNQASDQGDYDGAAKFYREAIEIWRSLGPDYDAHRAGSTMNLGTVLCGSGHRVECARTYEESLAVHRRTLGTRHLRTVYNMNLLAVDYLMLGDLEKAEGLLNEALPIARAEFPNDIQLARSLEGMASVLIRQGKFQEAVAPADEALGIAIRVAGDDSLEAALAYANAAETHRVAGHSDRALPLFRKAVALYEKSLTPVHPRLASVLSQEGLVLMQEGQIATAEQVMVRALSMLKEGCPACVVEIAIAEHNLGILRLKQKRYKDADAILTDSLNLREKFSAEPGPELASSLQTLAVARKLLHRDADAERLNRRAESILSFR